MDWDKLRTFHIVAEVGSLTHAGDSLGLSQSAVSRQISNLEQSLEVKLFHRHARGLVLTEEGELLASTAKEIFGKLSMIEARLGDSKSTPSGSMRITAPKFFGSTWMAPRLADIRTHYPKLQLSLIMDDRILNLTMREADAAIRLYKPDQQDLEYKSLGHIQFSVYGSQDYFKKHGTPKTLEELQNHTILGFLPNVPAPYENPNWLIRHADIQMEHNPNVILMNSLNAIYQSVQNHAGLAVLPNYLMQNTPSLQSCLDEHTPPEVEMFYVYSKDRKNSKRIKIIENFLADSIQETGF